MPGTIAHLVEVDDAFQALELRQFYRFSVPTHRVTGAHQVVLDTPTEVRAYAVLGEAVLVGTIARPAGLTVWVTYPRARSPLWGDEFEGWLRRYHSVGVLRCEDSSQGPRPQFNLGFRTLDNRVAAAEVADSLSRILTLVRREPSRGGMFETLDLFWLDPGSSIDGAIRINPAFNSTQSQLCLLVRGGISISGNPLH